jgi:hypothetical protein
MYKAIIINNLITLWVFELLTHIPRDIKLALLTLSRMDRGFKAPYYGTTFQTLTLWLMV